MAALGINIDLSTDFLEDRLTDNCKCEHAHRGSTPCSRVVTHRGYCCIVPAGQNICANAAERITRFIEQRTVCGHCDGLIADCWRVVKI